MGQKSNYDGKVKREKELNKEKIISNKLNQQDIGTEELGVVVGVTDRDVRLLIKKLCEKHPDILKQQDFKDGERYSFKAAWNGILTVLLSVAGLPQYDNRKVQNTLEGYLEFVETLIDGIDQYTTEYDKKMIKEHSTYQQAILEKKLYDSTIERLGMIVNQLGMLPASLRFQTLARINTQLKSIPSNIAQSHAAYMIERSMNKRKANDDEKETSFKENLEEYLVSLLKIKMQGKQEIQQYIKNDVLGRALLKQYVLGNFNDFKVKGLEEIVNNTRKKLLEQQEIKEIMDKITNVLNKDKPMEQMMLNWIEKTLVLFELTAIDGDKDKDLGKELLRRSVTEEVFRSLQEFNKQEYLENEDDID